MQKNDKKALYVDLSFGTPMEKELLFAPYKAIIASQGYKPDNIFARYSQSTIRTIREEDINKLGVLILNARKGQEDETRAIQKILLKKVPLLPYIVITESGITGSEGINIKSKNPFTDEEIKTHLLAAMQKFGQGEDAHKDIAQQMAAKKVLVMVCADSMYDREIEEGIAKTGVNKANLTYLHNEKPAAMTMGTVSSMYDFLEEHKPDILLLHGQLDVLQAVRKAYPNLTIVALTRDSVDTAPYMTAKKKRVVDGVLTMNKSCTGRLAAELPAAVLSHQEAGVKKVTKRGG